MTRQTTKAFLYNLGIEGNEAIKHYKQGWTLSEIKEGHEFVGDYYDKEVKYLKKRLLK